MRIGLRASCSTSRSADGALTVASTLNPNKETCKVKSRVSLTIDKLSATVLECHEGHELFCQVVLACCSLPQLFLAGSTPLEGKLSPIYKCKTKAYAYSISDI